MTKELQDFFKIISEGKKSSKKETENESLLSNEKVSVSVKASELKDFFSAINNVLCCPKVSLIIYIFGSIILVFLFYINRINFFGIIFKKRFNLSDVYWHLMIWLKMCNIFEKFYYFAIKKFKMW